MEAVRVAIIDDGVNRELCSRQDIIINCYELIDDQIKPIEGNVDISPQSHGTICTLIMTSFTKHLEIFSLNIIPQGSRTTSVNNLCTALKWCLENDIKIINMSLGTTYFVDYFILNPIIEQLYFNGAIVVAACNNNNIITFPASMPNVIGVKCDFQNELNENEFFFNEKDIRNIQITSCCVYSRLNGVSIDICNSYAAPYITALVINYTYEGINSFNQVIDRLKRSSNNNSILGGYQYDQKSITYPSDYHDIPNIGLLNCYSDDSNKIMKSISRVFQSYGYNCIFISDSFNLGNNFFKLQNYWNPPVSDAVKIYEMIVKVSLPDIVFTDITNNNSKYKVLTEEKMIDKLVVFCDVSQYVSSSIYTALAKEDIILIDPTKFKDNRALAELIYTQISNTYA